MGADTGAGVGEGVGPSSTITIKLTLNLLKSAHPMPLYISIYFKLFSGETTNKMDLNNIHR